MGNSLVSLTSPANILCVGNGWLPNMPGGLDRYVYELTHSLVTGQDQVELCGVGLPTVVHQSSLQLTNLADPSSPLWRRLWETRRNFLSRQVYQLNAINLHFALYSLPLLNSLPTGVPVTFTFHGPWSIESAQEGDPKLSVLIKHWVEQQVYRRCDRFIVLSQAFGTILHQHYQIPWSSIHVIPGGVDIHRFQANFTRQQAREQLHWPQDRFILFTPRRLVHRMGLSQLLTALAHVKARVPEVWLAIAGKGPLRSVLEQQVTKLGLADQVKFLGFLPEDQLPTAYQAADLTIVPSQSLEGFGLVVLESLACGTPVVCTPIGGMPEILEPFAPQLITESSQTEAIAAHLESVLTGQISLPSRTACRDYAATNFNWPHIAQQVRQVLLASTV